MPSPNNGDIRNSEKKLFVAFGFKLEAIAHIPIVTMYRLCMEKAFLENLQGLHVEAARRACRALFVDGIYRGTPEFDEMIQF